MHSFTFKNFNTDEHSIDKNIEHTHNVNPFFEFINQIAPNNLSNANQLTKNQASLPNRLLQLTSTEKNPSQQLKDPRKAYLQITEKRLQLQTKQQNNESLKQRRSRSRDIKRSHNRSSSSSENGKDRKDEHFRKTKICPQFEKGQCKKGSNCHFAHGYKELRCLPNFYKTKLCLAFARGECKKSSRQCKYAHGQKQLRSLKHDAGYSNTIQHSQKNRNRDDKSRKKRKEIKSQSVHRPNGYRDSFKRQQSRDTKKLKLNVKQDGLSYKKNIPLSKEYEKFLYSSADSNLSQMQSKSFFYQQDSMYMISKTVLNPSPASYTTDPYAINLKKQADPVSSKIAYSEYSSSYQKPFKDQPSENVFYKSQNNLRQYQKDYKTGMPFNAYSQVESSYQRNSHVPYPPLSANKPAFNGPSNSIFYENISDFGSNYARPPYTNTKKGGFTDQLFSNEVNNIGLAKDQNISGYSGSIYQTYPANKKIQKNQPFYGNDSFYSQSSFKNGNGGLNGFSNQSNLNSYPSNGNNFSSNGVYNLYPALDKQMSQAPSNSYISDNKSRYGGYSKIPLK